MTFLDRTDRAISRSDIRVLHAARGHGAVTRSALAARAGLTSQVVSNVLARLEMAGLMGRCGFSSGQQDESSHLYELLGQSRQSVGAHISRRGIRLVRIDLDGVIRSRRSTPLRAGFAPEDVLEHVLMATEVMRKEVEADGGQLAGVGLGVMGPFEHKTGIVRDAHQVHNWTDVPLAAMASDAFDVPICVEKDVTAAVLGESWALNGFKEDTALLHLEAGLGAGLWMHGTVHRGSHTNAGEFGHTVIDLDGPICACGRQGCLEAVHSYALESGDLNTAAHAIAVGALNLLETLDIDRIVLGGGDFLTHADVYLTAVQDAIEHHRPARPWRSVSTSAATYGADLVAAGAGLSILQSEFFDEDGPTHQHRAVAEYGNTQASTAMTRQTTTIRDVAARAGVSYQTVSRVINHHPSVRPSTRIRVRRAAKELGWTVSLTAQELRTRTTSEFSTPDASPSNTSDEARP